MVSVGINMPTQTERDEIYEHLPLWRRRLLEMIEEIEKEEAEGKHRTKTVTKRKRAKIAQAGDPFLSHKVIMTLPVHDLDLHHCQEVVGGFYGMQENKGFLNVIVHNCMLSYPIVSEHAKTLKEGLAGIPIGTRVGVFCLTIDGKSKIFVRIEDKQDNERLR